MVNTNVRTSERIAVILFLILLLMVVYQNCGMPTRVSDNIVHKLEGGDLSALQELEPTEKQAVCENSSFYSCIHTVFSPSEPESGVTMYTRCSDIFGSGERFCAMVNFKTENTSDELASCTDCSGRDSLPGGRYNREEIRCWNHMVRSGEIYPVAAQSTSLEETLSRAVTTCRETLRY
ncbi:MAG: hypothetical protein ABL958_06175 [Bdellovibrionia bacterium]